MAIEVMKPNDDLNTTDKETLYNLGQVGLGNFTSAALPDLERYFRLRSM
jgi:hypothetical protein